MKSFLQEVIQHIQHQEGSISDLIFILPSKRAGLFLKKEIIACFPNQTLLIPTILSIEEFIEQRSDMRLIDNTETLFQFYEAYLTIHVEFEKESFETFSTWAQTLIYDFNEIDRYLIDHESFFNYLSQIQDLNHWYLQKEKTELVQNYIRFWKHLHGYYHTLKENLLQQGIGYQGLLYRKAANQIRDYATATKKQHVFAGFNALNNAEQYIFQELLDVDKALVFWDTDRVFFNDRHHEASLFLRNYEKHWNYYKTNSFEYIRDNFAQSKEIDIIGTPKNVGQAKYVGDLLSTIPENELGKTAVVLADEALLLPVLNSLPQNVKALNITMGLPLREIPLASFFELLFELHKQSHPKGLYHKTILEIIGKRSVFWLLGDVVLKIKSLISEQNLVYVTIGKITNIDTSPDKLNILSLLFQPWKTVHHALENCTALIYALKKVLEEENSPLEMEYVYRFHRVFNQLALLNNQHKYIDNIVVLHQLYKDILSTESLDFRGEPFKGLQLMGMLESRCLDFDTVIITSVNEGVLPAGKSANSFIPYDLKRAYKLPTYREKDAIYTYHFYHLLQRAKKVYLLYNSENEGLGGGEKSRFLLQLQLDKQPHHIVKEYIASPKISKVGIQLITIVKNDEILAQIKAIATSGLSPSALTTYIRNPLDFYYQYILGVNDVEAVEETVAANTMGTIVHNVLENFYKPFEGRYLTVANIDQMISQIDVEVKKEFKETYSKVDITHGKNLIIFEVVKRYINNFLEAEKKQLSTGAQLKIIAIESNLKARIDIDGIDFPVYIKGKVDRIDELDGQLRIIDYKTGKVSQGEVEVVDWDVIIEDYKYSKVLQVLAYVYMYQANFRTENPSVGGIISFKNLKSGFLKFGTKASSNARKKENKITQEIFDQYLEILKKLILEIYDINTPFIEKET